MRKAQVSFEIMFAIGLIVFIFLILVYFVSERRIELYKLEETVNEKSECLKLSDAITSSFVVGTNTSITIRLNYDAVINSDARIINVGIYEYPCTIPLNNVRSSLGGHTFNLSKGDINIENNDGDLVVKNA